MITRVIFNLTFLRVSRANANWLWLSCNITPSSLRCKATHGAILQKPSVSAVHPDHRTGRLSCSLACAKDLSVPWGGWGEAAIFHCRLNAGCSGCSEEELQLCGILMNIPVHLQSQGTSQQGPELFPVPPCSVLNLHKFIRTWRAAGKASWVMGRERTDNQDKSDFWTFFFRMTFLPQHLLTSEESDADTATSSNFTNLYQTGEHTLTAAHAQTSQRLKPI